MNHMRRIYGWAIAVLVFTIVLLFRAAAWLSPSVFIDIPSSVALPLNGLGVLFLACGVRAWLAYPTVLTRAFLLYGVGMGIHWGGSIGTQSGAVDISLITLYAGATALGDGAFLDLSLRYPREASGTGKRTFALYLPAILTLLAVPVAPVLPRKVIESWIGAVIGLVFLMSLAGAVVFIVKWLRAAPVERRERCLTSIAVALIVSAALDLLAASGLLPGVHGAWQLSYGLVPIALAHALTRGKSSRISSSEGSPLPIR